MERHEIYEEHEVNKNTPVLSPDLANTLLGNIMDRPEEAVTLILNAIKNHDKAHLLYILIELGLYEENEDAFLSLQWSEADKKHIHDQVRKIKNKFVYYNREKASDLMDRLVITLFPEQAHIIGIRDRRAELANALTTETNKQETTV